MMSSTVPPAAGQKRAAKLELLLLALILLLAAFLRFYRLDSSSLWSDEGNTWALLSRSFAQIAKDAAADIHPPGYYWLLKLWSMTVGNNAWGMRSFSAVAGVLLVYVVYQLGRCLESNAQLTGIALLATLLAALNPFQIYYSQEARMYLLLALEGAGLFWALFAWPSDARRSHIVPALGYLLCGVAGLWTHYSFPVIWGAAILSFGFHAAQQRFVTQTPDQTRFAQQPSFSQYQSFWLFSGLTLLILLAYLPWLPIAVDRVLHWPKGGTAVSLVEGGKLALHTLIFGPLRDLPAVQWPWQWGAALLPIYGLLRHWRQPKSWQVGLWLGGPLLLMFGLGLFSNAFLKFLLTASPAWSLLMAVGIRALPYPRYTIPLCAAGALILAALTLPAYYMAPSARDNYAGIARYLQATADPAQTLVVLDAPGQQEVWDYYNPGLTTLALPQQRPPDAAATLQALQKAVAERATIYALFWATDEADPDRIVEHWLDQHAFKGLDSWQGNLRFVNYSLPTALHCTPMTPAPLFGEAIQLTQLCQPTTPQTVTAGDVALVGLQWQALTPLDQRYNVTVQVLDRQNSVLAQRDSEPVGGSQPTDQWTVGQTVVDQHGVLIPPGTPPGIYQLILALYDSATGERLHLPGEADHLVLGEIDVVRPRQPLTATLLPLQHPLNRRVGPLHLVGYSAHRKGMAHAPATPVVASDRVEFTFFWQAPDPLPADWPAMLTFTLTLGDQSLTMPVAGEGYPTSQWQAGELVRTKAELLYTGKNPVPQLVIAHDSTTLPALPGASWWQEILGNQ